MENIQEVLLKLRESIERNTQSSLITPYDCEQCHDTGWIETDPVTRAVRKCPCQLAKEAKARMENSGLKDALELQTFDSFVVKSETQKAVKSLAERYLTDLFSESDNPRRPWLYIGGSPGSGKTHICTAVCGELLKKNISVRYMQWLDVARRLKAIVNDESFDDEVEKYINVSVLYIDDLLKQKYVPNPVFTDADIKIAFTILNGRYLQNKPTIITSEWDLMDQLMPADDGVFSRVYERSKGYTIMISRRPENNYRRTA